MQRETHRQWNDVFSPLEDFNKTPGWRLPWLGCRFALLLIVATGLIACSSSPVPSAGASASQAGASATPSIPPPAEPTPSPTSEVPQPETFAQLDAKVPTEVGGYTANWAFDWTADQLLASLADPIWVAFISDLGNRASDFMIVLRRGGALGVVWWVSVVQVGEMTGDELLTRYEDAVRKASTVAVDFHAATISGKSVQVGDRELLYTSGRLLFVVYGSDDALAAAALAALP